MLGNRYSQHSFAQIPDVNIARSQFDRSHTIKDTFNFDYLVPIFVDEILPGDTANVSLNSFARLSSYALKSPIMDNVMMDFFFFFVPSRLVWTNWERFNGAQDDPTDTTDYVLPTITAPTVTGFTVNSLFDKFGLPTGVASLVVNNSLPLRCYNKIYNDWFRDQNLQDSIPMPTDDGPDDVADFELRKRGKRHDYFTSCLPWPQKGNAVELPLGTEAPVLGIGKRNQTFGGASGTVYESTGATDNYTAAVLINNAAATNDFFVESQTIGGSAYPYIRADLSAATAATINELREAWALQTLFELDARGGTRYVEILQAHFNVISPDFRLQRAEYLGGGSTRINSHPVAQTSPTSGSNALGALGAFGTSSQTGNQIGFTKSFTEHGYVIGLVCARADLTYQQGMNRMWNRTTRYEFFWPKLQELGEQAVLNKEIYAQGTAADEDVFGYQERYAEYRYKPSEIHGEFRSTYSTPLDYWHMAEEFLTLPELNSTFIVQNTPIERALAVTTGPDILLDVWYRYKHARPMMAYSTPSSIGRF